jgi:RHS repeat-associated protein
MGFDYDPIGNITKLTRYALLDPADPERQIDQLEYKYHSSLSYGEATTPGSTTDVSRLRKIRDLSPSAYRANGFDPGSAGSSAQYGYDANGNLTSDPYKNLSIAYNHLNLPKQAGGLNIVYDASGRKWRQYGTGYTREYISGLEFEDGDLVAAVVGDGRLVIGETTYRDKTATGGVPTVHAEYWHKDHLGNVRLTFADLNQDGIVAIVDDASTPHHDVEILQENDYYSFGLRYPGELCRADTTPVNRYRYNGKELVGDLGLNWYAYGARYYDAAIGRFTGVDPIADQFPWVNTYNYAENEPVGSIDLHGLQRVRVNNIRNDQGEVIRRDVSVSISLKLINLSNTESYNYNGAVSSFQSKAKSTFSGGLNSRVLDTPQRGITNSEVPVNISFSANVTPITSLSQVKSTDFVMMVVDNIKNSPSGDAAGRGQEPGNLSVVEAEEIKKGSPEIMLHEIGHNLGFPHTEGGLMNPELNKEFGLNSSDFKSIMTLIGATGGNREAKYNNTASSVRKFLNATTTGYDKKKAEQAGID